MNTNANHSLRKLASTSLMISLGLLALHIYVTCYWLFDHWRLSSRLTDRLLLQIGKSGWLDGVRLRLTILVFLGISMVRAPGHTGNVPSWKNFLLLLAGGLALFWGSPLLLYRQGDPELTCWGYIVALTVGYCLVHIALSRGRRLLQRLFDIKQSFGQEKEGFPQETRRLDGEFSLHLPARYTWKGQTANSWVNFINPRRGILVVGSPGSGKSRFIIEPLIRQLVQQRQALFVYDFKYPALTRPTYGYFMASRGRYPATTGFYSIQFSDLSRSHRCNVLEPSTLGWVSDALGVAR